MKVKEVISVINNADYYSLISAQRAAGLCKEDLIVETIIFQNTKTSISLQIFINVRMDL